MPKKILFVVNNPLFFVQQHLHLAEAARAAGYDTHVAAPDWEGADTIRAAGFAFHPIRMPRGANGPIKELRALWDQLRLYMQLRPDLVHHITWKSIFYGTFAARLAGIKAVVNVNTGLGFLFIDDSRKTSRLRSFLFPAYRLTIAHPNRRDVFLNEDDHADMRAHDMADDATTEVIPYPGVDMDEFPAMPEPDGVPTVVLPARMLWHKGVGEFVEAARLLRQRGVDARFALVGDPDPGNPVSLTKEELEAFAASGDVAWWGYQTDMPGVFAKAHIVALPSYREGLGKVLIEGASCTRPLVATDVPGCREVIRDGVNGFLVPAQDAEALAEALGKLIQDAPLRQQMGQVGRAVVKALFSNEVIQHRTLDLYHRLLHDQPAPRRKRALLFLSKAKLAPIPVRARRF